MPPNVHTRIRIVESQNRQWNHNSGSCNDTPLLETSPRRRKITLPRGGFFVLHLISNTLLFPLYNIALSSSGRRFQGSLGYTWRGLYRISSIASKKHGLQRV